MDDANYEAFMFNTKSLSNGRLADQFIEENLKIVHLFATPVYPDPELLLFFGRYRVRNSNERKGNDSWKFTFSNLYFSRWWKRRIYIDNKTSKLLGLVPDKDLILVLRYKKHGFIFIHYFPNILLRNATTDRLKAWRRSRYFDNSVSIFASTFTTKNYKVQGTEWNRLLTNRGRNYFGTTRRYERTIDKMTERVITQLPGN